MPSTPLDAYGLLLSAIEDPNPVLFLKPKALMRTRGEQLLPGEPETEKELKAMIDAPIGDRKNWKPKWPNLDTNFRIPIGQAKIWREGDRATVVSYGRMLHLCVRAADELREESGVSVEVIDLRSIYPYDGRSKIIYIKNTPSFICE